MAARGPEVRGAIYVRRLSVDWNICQTAAKWFVHFYSFILFQKTLKKSPRGYLKGHTASREQF